MPGSTWLVTKRIKKVNWSMSLPKSWPWTAIMPSSTGPSRSNRRGFHHGGSFLLSCPTLI
jgi:hypothetical protein